MPRQPLTNAVRLRSWSRFQRGIDARRRRLDGQRLELLLLFAITWLDGGIYQVYGKPPSNPGQEQWLTLQSTSSTCSPAALSALLALYNVRRTEGELIVDCMTTNRGTPLQGIWRGLVKNCPPGFRPNLRHYPEDISARIIPAHRRRSSGKKDLAWF